MRSISYSIIPVLLILLTNHVNNTDSLPSYLPWRNADKVIELMCPASHICDVKPRLNNLKDRCCTDCYCGDECVDGLKCCFRDNIKEDYETCLYLSSKFNNFFGFTPVEATALSFYVVTKSPANGCLYNRGKCDASDTSTIFPGYSQKTRKVYFNRDCAICHGVDDFEEAVAYFFCDELGSSHTLNFDVEISKFLDGDKSSLCFFSYEIRVAKGIQHRVCSIHSTESIHTLINITNVDHLSTYYNMSLDDIISACTSSLFAATFSKSKMKLYPNPFCYILGEGTHKAEKCYVANANPSDIHFFVLINPDVKDDLRLDADRQTVYRDQVCVKTTEGSSINKYERCRPMTCPIGHIFNKDGVCNFFGFRIFEQGRMRIYLNLVMIHKEKHITGEDLFNQTIDDIEDYIQLPDDWGIAFWGVSVDGLSTTGNIIIILELVNADLPVAIESITPHLNKDVVILNETYTISIYGKKLLFKDVLPDDVLAVTQCSTAKRPSNTQLIRKGDSEDRNISELQNLGDRDSMDKTTSQLPQIIDDVPDCWKMVAFSVHRYNTITVVPLSKLYFCNLVQMMNDEYRLLANGSLMFNEILGVYLHENEFLVQHQENGERIIKVCLEDSGLSQPVGNSSPKHGYKNMLIIPMVVLFIYKALCLL